MVKTVISNFYNEEYMLPWWLEHHKKIDDFINRKLSFRDRVRKEDLEKGMGGHYLWNREKMEEERKKLLIKCKHYDY